LAKPTAQQVLDALGLTPHPEGGAFRETWRDAHGTAIFYMLRAGERSHWHRISQTEMWHFYAGAALRLEIAQTGGPTVTHRLGADILAGERPQVVVPPSAWQSAQSLGEWTLVGCTVSPPFAFETFELAPPGFVPGDL
jgi:uncharacterized protein